MSEQKEEFIAMLSALFFVAGVLAITIAAAWVIKIIFLN